MSKENPFFKFDTASWLSGSIQFTSLECKGLFIDLCALYWESEKPIKIDSKFKVRTRCDEGTLSDLKGALSDLEIIKENELGITIPFLDKLKDERKGWLKKCSESGKKSAKNKGTSSNKKEERRKKNEESRIEIEEKEPLWLLDAQPEYLDYCQRFFEMLKENNKTTKSMNWKTKGWYDPIRLMVNSDGVKIEELNSALEFLRKHCVDTYCPQCYSPQSLRDKWINLKNYIEKTKGASTQTKSYNQPVNILKGGDATGWE